MNDFNKELIELYEKMYQHTFLVCKGKCKLPLSCCSPEYCAVAYDCAKDEWDTELKLTNHKTLPLMGIDGCIASPHFRPMCTIHVCEINGMGFTKDKKWDDIYFDLRERINELQVEKLEIYRD